MEELIEPYLNHFALILLLCMAIGGVYLIIFIHDIPYEIAKKRNHPHQDAFHAAGWVSLFLMHTIWPLLWIWAYWYKEDSPQKISFERSDSEDQIAALESQIEMLKSQLKDDKKNTNPDSGTNPKDV